MYNHNGSRKRCNYCDATVFSGSTCNPCERAAEIVERSWPDAEDKADLVKKVRIHLTENVSVHPDGWSESKKLKYEVLRARKDLLRNRFEGRRVRWKEGYHDGEGVVESIKIHHGQIFYHLDNREKGLKRHRLDNLEAVDDESQDSFEENYKTTA